MVSTLNTYFGDYLNGLFVKWESAPADTSGTSDITITFTMNMRAKMYVYGYGGTYKGSLSTYEPDSQDGWSNDAFINYDDNATPPGVTTPVYPADESELYHFYLAWKNPDTAATVTYDGIEVKAYAKVTLPDTNLWTQTLDALGAAPPLISVYLLPNDSDNTGSCSGTCKYFDIHPGSQFASGDAVSDYS